MNLQKRIEDFAKLGEDLNQLHLTKKLDKLFEKVELANPWFTADNLNFAFKSIIGMLKKDSLSNWLKNYNVSNKQNDKTIAVVMAGNIPLVGFHDFLSVLITGYRVKVKMSSKDNILPGFIAEKLIEVNPEYKNRIELVEDRLNNFDAIIATGSNNTSRYFDYYFGKYPNIIRKNKNSTAIISGNETEQDLKNLAKDIFVYFGLGCRSVSKLYVPPMYNFSKLFEAFEIFSHYKNHNKYMNNYEYYRSVYMLNEFKFFDNNWLIITQEKSLASPISVIYFEEYQNDKELEKLLIHDKEKTQAISALNPKEDQVGFGEIQKPALNDYADGIDTIEFLIGLK